MYKSLTLFALIAVSLAQEAVVNECEQDWKNLCKVQAYKKVNKDACKAATYQAVCADEAQLIIDAESDTTKQNQLMARDKELDDLFEANGVDRLSNYIDEATILGAEKQDNLDEQTGGADGEGEGEGEGDDTEEVLLSTWEIDWDAERCAADQIALCATDYAAELVAPDWACTDEDFAALCAEWGNRVSLAQEGDQEAIAEVRLVNERRQASFDKYGVERSVSITEIIPDPVEEEVVEDVEETRGRFIVSASIVALGAVMLQ